MTGGCAGKRLNKEAELQQMFNVSRGSMRDALKALEVQGLVSLSTGPEGGATITRVPLARAFQALQNYLFFENITLEALCGATHARTDCRCWRSRAFDGCRFRSTRAQHFSV